MAILPILIAPDPRLKRRAEAVSAVGPEVRRLMDDMLETMYAAAGIGLAAPQVGVLLRVVVLDVAEKNEPPSPLCMINPAIVWASPEIVMNNEGCLSLPEQYADVERPSAVRVGYLDRQGTPQELEAAGILSTCLQHEMDHLEGTLFVDHISLVRRSMILRRLQKLKGKKDRDL